MKNKKIFLTLMIGGMILFPITTKALEESTESISSTENKLKSQISSTVESTSNSTMSDSSTLEKNEATGESDNTISSTEESSDTEQEMILPTEGEADFGGYSLPRNRSDLSSAVNGRMTRASIPSVLASNKNTPTKSFVDISSHNGTLSVNDFNNMKKYGVTGVVVKLTEATSYKNPYAASQVKNAKAAGLKVSAYHYSWFKTDSQARAEADYFANFAKSIGLDSSTVMVNDIEEPQIAGKGNHTANSVAFENRLKQLGFPSIRHYSSLSWFNGLINANTIGKQKIWVAAYPYTITNKNYYTDYSSWQWNSRLRFPEIANKEFDISADYNNSFTGSTSTPKPDPKPDPQPDPNAPVSYSSHVKDKGWLNFVSNDNVSGTVGEARRIEALKMTISNKFSGNIEYQSHIQNIGWESTWKTNGQISGTTGQAKQIEALKIRLTGEVSKQYDIYYRVHSQAFGWLNWVKNGEAAGTEGFAYRLEAYQVKLVPKGQAAPSGQGRGFFKYQDASVSYQSHVQNKGWMPSVNNGQISGTVGNSLRLEALKLKISNNPLAFSGNVEYQTHSQYIGWQNWKSNFNMAGTEGQGLRAEAVKIRLTGDLALHYNVYYRAHCQTYGWQNWVKDGEVAGTTGKGKQMEAIQVKIIRKNSAAPK